MFIVHEPLQIYKLFSGASPKNAGSPHTCPALSVRPTLNCCALLVHRILKSQQATAMAASNSQKFPYAYADVYAAINQTLRTNGYTIKMADPNIGRFEVRSGASLFSWGETLWVTAEDADGRSTIVSVSSSLSVAESPITLISAEGRNAKHITTIMTGISAYLRANATPVKASPPPQTHLMPPPFPAPPVLYLHLNGKVQGPFTTAQVKAFLQVGTATLDTLCCINGSAQWMPLSSFGSLAS